MGRYTNIPNTITEDNITRKNILYEIPIDLNNADNFWILSNPEKIHYNAVKLAKHYYGDGKLWWIIAKANDVKHPYNIDFETIIIPKDISTITNNTR